MLRLPVLAVGVFIAWLAAPHTRPAASLDPELFVTAGCQTCHGSEAVGGIGPTLAGTELTFDAFLEQLRAPRGVMPAVDARTVSDDQARTLFDYVTALAPPEEGPVAGSACAEGCCGARSHHGGACRHHRHGSRGRGACACRARG